MRAMAFLGVLVATAATACGEAEELQRTGPSPAVALERACDRAGKRFTKFSELPEPKTRREFIARFDLFSDAFNDFRDELEHVPPPPRRWGAAFRRLRSAVYEAHRDSLALRAFSGSRPGGLRYWYERVAEHFDDIELAAVKLPSCGMEEREDRERS